MVEYVVAIDVTRVRFPADANYLSAVIIDVSFDAGVHAFGI